MLFPFGPSGLNLNYQKPSQTFQTLSNSIRQYETTSSNFFFKPLKPYKT
jgi:hypothetical protein